jgi:hypothetical protein
MPFCPQCGVDNPESARYCDQCGAMLIPVPAQTTAPATAPATSVPAIGPTVCPQCGQAAIPGEAFCDNCGAPLSAHRAPLLRLRRRRTALHHRNRCTHRRRRSRFLRLRRSPARHRAACARCTAIVPGAASATRARRAAIVPGAASATHARRAAIVPGAAQRNPRLPDLQCRLRHPRPSADEHLSLHRCWLSSALALPCRCPQHRRQSSGAATRSVSFILISISIRMAHSIRRRATPCAYLRAGRTGADRRP